MRHIILILLIILPLILCASVADIIVKGSNQELRLTEEDFKRLFPDSDYEDSVNVDRFIMYGMKLLAAKESGLDTLLGLNRFAPEIANDILVGEWTNREINGRVNEHEIEEYFLSNKDKFKWEAPRFKGRIIIGENDSVVNKAVEELKLKDIVSTDSIKIFLRKQFGTTVAVVAVLTEQGRNPYVDSAVFGNTTLYPDSKWRFSKQLDGYLLLSPESYSDVKDLLIDEYIKTIVTEIETELRLDMTVEYRKLQE
ncbi:MAG: hypothetical protein J1E38_08505 [Paramuribaculum sp.]|nr:hypothetical protein [Paramuribaculum sp.]